MIPKKYLVTGGLGFIGSALVKRLAEAGHLVRILDNGSRGSLERLGAAADSVEFLEADIRDANAVMRAGRGIDAVCHLAYVNGTRFFYEQPELVLEVGVKGIVNLLDSCMAGGIKEMFLASSSEVYQIPPTVPTDESVPLIVPDVHNPRFSYSGGKIISELMAIHYGRAFFDRVVVFRPHNVYGPDMGWDHVIPELVMRMRDLVATSDNPVSLPVQGTGQETRAFIYISDFIEGLLQIMDGGEHLGVYNIGTTEQVTVERLASEVGNYFGRAVRIVPGERRPGSTPHRCPDITKVSALGFKPQYSLREGLEATIRWYDENAHLRPTN
ncbi:MAG: NAD-dependent epimerase/dehydratase family protein [Anaerolineales bacterium]